jgi:hypothetical protein
MVHNLPAPIAVALLVSSPVHRLPPASTVRRFVFAAANEKFEAFAPLRSAPPNATKVKAPLETDIRQIWLLPGLNGLPATAK